MVRPMEVTVVEHPVVQDRLARLRHVDTSPESFRRGVHEIAMLMAFEATRCLAVRHEIIPTPVAPAKVKVLARPVVVVPILRAGLGMLQGMLALLPEALIGHIGMARNEETKRPESYFLKLPPGIADADVLLVDPMLATGYSGAAAATKLKEAGASSIAFVSILATPEGKNNLPGNLLKSFIAWRNHAVRWGLLSTDWPLWSMNPFRSSILHPHPMTASYPFTHRETRDTAHQSVAVWGNEAEVEFRVTGAIHAWLGRDQFLTGLAWDAITAGLLSHPSGNPKTLLMLRLGGGTSLRTLRHLCPESGAPAPPSRMPRQFRNHGGSHRFREKGELDVWIRLPGLSGRLHEHEAPDGRCAWAGAANAPGKVSLPA